MATTKKTTTTAAKVAAPAKKTTVKKAAPKKTASKKVVKKVEEPLHIGLVRNDSWLEPFEGAIRGRHDHALWKIGQLTRNGKQTLSQFASGHLYFGLHKLAKGWVFREWAPNATDIYLIGDFNNWQETEKYRCKRIEGTGNWELKLSEKALKHGTVARVSVFPLGAVVWYKMTKRRFSLPRCGTQRNLMYGRKRPSSPISLLC